MVRIRFIFSVVSLLAISSLPMRSGAEPRGAAPRATGGPDSFGYSFTDSQEANGPSFNSVWEDISTTGTLIFGANVDDSVSGAVSIPFQFPFYGTNYSTCYVSSNGNMHFTSPSAGYPAVAFPNAGAPNAMIAGFWADDHTGPDGHIRYAGDSNRFIVQWTSCEYYPSDNAETFTYQIKLLPSGIIYIAYQTMSANGGSNSTGIGIENESGSVGLQYCLNGSPNVIANNRVIRFANNTPPAVPATLTQAASPGGAGLVAGSLAGGTLYFRGTLSDPNAGNTVGLQVEVLPATTLFQTGITGPSASTPANALVASGNVAEVSINFAGPGLGDGSYHWRARAFDNGGATSTWVEFSQGVASFFVDGTPPSAPTAPFSPSGESISSATPQSSVGFSWGPAIDAGPPLPLTYFVEVSTDPSFATVEYSDVAPGTTYSASFPVGEQEHYWRVSAMDRRATRPVGGADVLQGEENGRARSLQGHSPCAIGWGPRVDAARGFLFAGVPLIRRR
jgi:hypothetical protein